MKKVLPLALALAVAASGMMFANGAADSGKAAGANSGLITVGYAQVGAESDWRTANTQSFKETFVESNGYKLIFDDAQQKQENQIKAIRNFIQQDVDYIVVAPVVETGWETVLKEAKEKQIPVILSDRQMKLSDDSLYLCWVGGNFLKEGQDSIKWLNAKRGNEKLNIVLIQGTIGSSAQIGRTQGITEGIAANKNWTLLTKQSGDFTQKGGQEVMESFLKSYPKIDVVFCENDNEAWGAIDAIKAAGKVPGKDIWIICFDAVHETFNRMIAGEINCAVECNPLHGPRVDEIIKGLEKGEKPNKIMYVTEGVFDQDNAAAMLPTRKY